MSHAAPVIVPRPPNTGASGVQATSSFHSVSSIDSSAEMARYFPEAQTPNSSSQRHSQEPAQQYVQSGTTATTNNNHNVDPGPYRTVPAQPTQQQRQAPARPPPGVPSYVTQIEGLSISQALVNDVLVDLQAKVINESQQQFLSESTAGQYLEPLAPIHIRAPNPTIILRSDLNRLRAEFERNVRARAQQRARGMNQFSQNRFSAPGFSGPRFY